MPRLFINDYSAKDITSKLSNLCDYYVETRVRKMLFSPEGIFQIKGNNLTKLIPVDIPPIKLDGFTVDNSYFTETDIISQIPFNSTFAEIVEMHFCVDKKSCVHLVVEGVYKPTDSKLLSNLISSTKESTNNNQRYAGFIPHCVYFYSLENLDNELISKEVNMLVDII